MPRVVIDLAIAGAIDLQELAEALSRRFHDRIRIVEAAQLIVQIQEKFLPPLRVA